MTHHEELFKNKADAHTVQLFIPPVAAPPSIISSSGLRLRFMMARHNNDLPRIYLFVIVVLMIIKLWYYEETERARRYYK